MRKKASPSSMRQSERDTCEGIPELPVAVIARGTRDFVTERFETAGVTWSNF